MEVEDLGDLQHKHTHIHRVPILHQNTLNTVLKDWCMGIFDEEKCKPLNESNFDQILNSSNEEVKMSKVYSNLLNLEDLSATDTQSSIPLKFFIRETRLNLELGEEKNYESEIIYDKRNNKFYADFTISRETAMDFVSPSTSPGISLDDGSMALGNLESTPIIHIRVDIESDGFSVNNKKVYFSEGDGEKVRRLKNELEKMNLREILQENRILIDNIGEINKSINREKISIPDNLTPKRNIQSLEKLDKKILRELVILLFYFLIGICFGIYCIYFFFVVELK
jgi:hypothetical protein